MSKHSKYYYDKDRNMEIKASNDFKPVVDPKFQLELENLLEELKTTLHDRIKK